MIIDRTPRCLIVLALALGLNCRSHYRSLAIATTTSVDGSGLLQQLRVPFERETGILLNAFVIGSGAALRFAAEGKVDLTITHDPDAEHDFVAKYHPALYRQFMWNDFVIVGPADDPAKASSARSAMEAFHAIYDAHAKFLSRNDQSGTNMKELAFWRAARVNGAQNPNYLPIGQPMAHLLRSADELQAYSLTDRTTFDSLAPSLRLRIVFAGDPGLRNVYAVTLMRRPDSDEYRRAQIFARWLLSPEARQIVESFRIRGHQELHWIDSSAAQATRASTAVR